MTLRGLLLGMVCAVGWANPALSQDFNKYVLAAVKLLKAGHSNGGYDINSVFTHDLSYGNGVIKASNPTKTMCVAAVTEVMITAVNLYSEETGDRSVYDKIPLTAWTQGNVLSLRANIFMFAGTGSRGTGHTLLEFQLGEELLFRDLKAGDFINLNRTGGSGHAVVFLGYLKSDLSESETYGNDIVGFRYFSSQGNPDNGFGYRYAFFDGTCPSGTPVARDCRIIRSDNRALLNAGRMWDSGRWAYKAAVEQKRARTRSILEDANPAATKGTIEFMLQQELQKDLDWDPAQKKAFENVAAE